MASTKEFSLQDEEIHADKLSDVGSDNESKNYDNER